MNGTHDEMLFEELLVKIHGGSVLDIGCGSGQFIGMLMQSLGSFDSITGVDVDEEVLQEARSTFSADTFNFIKASSQSLPFEDASFDFVSISKALHHVEDDRRTLAEMKRVLRPGGYLLISEMIRDGLSETQESHLLYHHLRSEIDQLLGISHHKTYMRSDLLDLIDSIGLDDLLVKDYTPPGPEPKDPGNIDDYIGKMEGWLEDLEGHPERENYRNRMAVLSEHIREQGISRPTQILALGKKRNNA
jgi:SAM-dependent methyltransferase